MSDDAQLAAFGRRVAAAQGYDASDDQVDWLAYGRAAQNQVGRRRPVPDPQTFHASPTRPGRPPVAAGPPPPPPSRQERAVRIGRFEVRYLDTRSHPPLPGYRTRRKGEQTTGRYRSRSLAAALRAHDRVAGARGAAEWRRAVADFQAAARRAHREQAALERRRRRAVR